MNLIYLYFKKQHKFLYKPKIWTFKDFQDFKKPKNLGFWKTFSSHFNGHLKVNLVARLLPRLSPITLIPSILTQLFVCTWYCRLYINH